MERRKAGLRQHWSKHTILKFGIHNEEQILLRLIIRIDGKKDPSYSNRYNNIIILKCSMNHISIPLNSMRTFETDRKIDLTNDLVSIKSRREVGSLS